MMDLHACNNPTRSLFYFFYPCCNLTSRFGSISVSENYSHDIFHTIYALAEFSKVEGIKRAFYVLIFINFVNDRRVKGLR